MEFSRNPDDIIHPFKGKGKMPKVSFRPFLVLAGIILLLILVFGSFYTIEKDSVGVVLRFGKYVRTSEPGLNFKIPLGVEKVYPVKVDFVYKEEFGFRTKQAGVRTQYDTARSYDAESLLLTGDLNVLDVEWIVRYRIKDPYAAIFKVRNVVNTLRDISESVMRKIIGDYSFNEVLTAKRNEINDLSRNELQRVLDEYGAGIEVIEILLQDINPPDPVKPAFNEVNAAKQEKEKLINQAWEIYNQKIPQARGEALKMIKEAEGYALERVNRAEGDANRFTLLLEQYSQSKEVTRKRLYLEQMSDILRKTGKKYVVDSQEQSILPLLRLDQ